MDRALAQRRPAATRVREALEARTTPLAVAGIVVVALAARIALNPGVSAPWAQPDELEYAELAKNFIASGHYLFREHPYFIPTIYPALISPAWLAGSIATTYALVKAMNAAMLTLAAIPLYLWARRLVSPGYSLLAVVLYLAIPSFVYAGAILTESAYAPAVLLALFSLALALERPTVTHQLLALGLAALCVSIRVQGVVFLLIIPTAIVLKALLDVRSSEERRWRPVLRDVPRRFAVTLAAIALTLVGYGVYRAAGGGSVSSRLGIYGYVTSTHYSLRVASEWVVYHLAELALSVGLVPFSALIVLLGLAWARKTSVAERAFLAAAAAAITWEVIEVGTFASPSGFRIQERYLFNLAPVLLLALVVWLARGLPRPPVLTAVAVVVPTALLLTLPYSKLLTTVVFNSTFALIPLWRLRTALGSVIWPVALAVAGAVLLGLLFAIVPRQVARWALPTAVLGFLMLSSASVYATITWQARGFRHAGGLRGDPSWIDHAIGKGKRVELLYTADITDGHVVWQAEFWNRSVRRLFGVTAQDASIPDVNAPLDADGRIVPDLPAGSPDLHPRFVLAATGVAVAGTRIASSGQLVLWRVRSPLRLLSPAAAATSDGWPRAGRSNSPDNLANTIAVLTGLGAY